MTQSLMQYRPKVWTLTEYLALPEASEETRACPNCPGRHFGSLNPTQKAPSAYRCHGTSVPNHEDAPFVPPCDTVFRGRPGDHFDADYYAEFFVKEPDEMGVWSDYDETIWLPRSLYPKRWDAIKWAMSQWSVGFPEVRCLARWMRYTPHIAGGYTRDDGTVDPGWSEDLWTECKRGDLGAFRVWRLESS